MPGSFPLVTLVVLDGWGCAPAGLGNAVELAETPVFDRLWRDYPHQTLAASGEAVGLPPGQMGNSEVGHLTIGSGRILFQDLMRVNEAVSDGSLLENQALVGAFERARVRGGHVHLLGLVSTGGVHSHLEHLQALLELSRRLGLEERTWIHAFTDGRDVSPTSALADLATLPPERIATIVGRYYAMDRDKRWERTERAL
ncbi:MAG: 2,3-bisphosphoglycerate-independent phosphoglycerate mutase, partial [Actinobacteria bacterium]|nr:2,3-bisphosphoglycerate-independent phosphoglycerate mutase [Actinomycetota bacterium]